jgi:anaerobic magnesium-protoporphyrin IX monomethyl ester cyclase
VDLLERSGLVTASFGLESGSSRVLELMGKGRNRVEQVYEPAMRAFEKSAIGLQPKFFFGFPGERDDDRKATIDFLNRHRDVLSIVTSGNVFDLTAGSIVAKNPEKFGLKNLRRKEGQDINGGMDYELITGEPVPRPADFADINAALDYFHPFERPWAGGIDTFHSKLYLRRYGRGVFHVLQEQFRRRDEITRPWVGASIASRFDLDEVFQRVLVSGALQYQCMLSLVEQSATREEIEAELNEIRRPLPSQPRPVNYAVRFF